VKNHLELKHARRVLIEGNDYVRHWAAGQQHYIVFTVRNQGGGNPWATVEDVTFRNNRASDPVQVNGAWPRGINFLGSDNDYPSQREKRFLIENNLFANRGDFIQIVGGVIDLVVRHNTVDGAQAILFTGQPPNQRLVFTDNIVGAGRYGVVYGDAIGSNCTSAFATYAPDIRFESNEFFGPYPTSGGFTPSMCAVPGATNYWPADRATVLGPDYRQTSAVHTGTDGRKIGADMDALEAALGGGP
jgi:hypothetical protein